MLNFFYYPLINNMSHCDKIYDFVIMDPAEKKGIIFDCSDVEKRLVHLRSVSWTTLLGVLITADCNLKPKTTNDL